MSFPRPTPVALALAPLALAAGLALGAAAPAAWADEPVDLDAVNRIRDEGLNRSQVMEIARQLTEEIGPRLTGSPGMLRANEWTRDTLAEWGLENAHLEAWGPFGRGWSFDRAVVHLVEPFPMPLIALPHAWTPGTDGPLRGEVVRATLDDEKDVAAYRGTLGGKIVLLDDARDLTPWEEGVIDRHSPEDLAALGELEIPEEDDDDARRKRFRKMWDQRQRLNAFLVEEGAIATIEVSSRDAGLVRPGGRGSRWADDSPGVPALMLGVDHYNRLVRLAGPEKRPKKDEEGDEGDEAPDQDGEDGEEPDEPADDPGDAAQDDENEDEEAGEGEPRPPVVLEIDVVARFHDDDPMAYNTIAEIPGSDLAREIVMVGAHLDSWHPATGATDNAAGSAIVMEAVRILQAAGLRPRRTIRVALWSGEEQGLLGSRAYVAEHFAEREPPPGEEDPEAYKLPEFLIEDRGPLVVKPEHARLSAYFNLDNGGGKIRGIYAEGNVAVAPIFEAWLRPLHDLGATTVTTHGTGGTDHLSFDRVGLPGFQFVQDMRDYFNITHHTNADTFDHLSREDLIQASVVLATFLHHAANRDERLPRKPMPQDD